MQLFLKGEKSSCISSNQKKLHTNYVLLQVCGNPGEVWAGEAQQGNNSGSSPAGLNTGRYKSSLYLTPTLIPREILTAQEHKVAVLNSQGLAGQGGVGEPGRHQQITQLTVQQG